MTNEAWERAYQTERRILLRRYPCLTLYPDAYLRERWDAMGRRAYRVQQGYRADCRPIPPVPVMGQPDWGQQHKGREGVRFLAPTTPPHKENYY